MKDLIERMTEALSLQGRVMSSIGVDDEEMIELSWWPDTLPAHEQEEARRLVAAYEAKGGVSVGFHRMATKEST